MDARLTCIAFNVRRGRVCELKATLFDLTRKQFLCGHHRTAKSRPIKSGDTDIFDRVAA